MCKFTLQFRISRGFVWNQCIFIVNVVVSSWLSLATHSTAQLLRVSTEFKKTALEIGIGPWINPWKRRQYSKLEGKLAQLAISKLKLSLARLCNLLEQVLTYLLSKEYQYKINTYPLSSDKPGYIGSWKCIIDVASHLKCVAHTVSGLESGYARPLFRLHCKRKCTFRVPCHNEHLSQS